MRKILVVATLFLGTLSGQGQEKVMDVRKTNGTSTRTPVADLRQISFLNAEDTTMITRLTNGAIFRTDVNEVEEITFADTLYNLNSTGYRILETGDLCWPEDRLLPIFLAPATPVRTLDMNAAKLSSEERVMFCTLQGIVNRSRPRILLYNHNEEPQTTWPTAHSLKTTAMSPAAPYSLVKLFKEEINGLVLYSNKLTNHYSNLAVTVAGLNRLLPVTAEIKAKLEANGMEFPVVEDLTPLTMNTALGVYNYLYNNYWSRCNHRLLISEQPTIPYVHDIGAACGSACVWLDPRTQSERMLLDKMLKDMTPGRDFVLGWYPEERSGVGEATKYGLSCKDCSCSQASEVREQNLCCCLYQRRRQHPVLPACYGQDFRTERSGQDAPELDHKPCTGRLFAHDAELLLPQGNNKRLLCKRPLGYGICHALRCAQYRLLCKRKFQQSNYTLYPTDPALPGKGRPARHYHLGRHQSHTAQGLCRKLSLPVRTYHQRLGKTKRKTDHQGTVELAVHNTTVPLLCQQRRRYNRLLQSRHKKLQG